MVSSVVRRVRAVLSLALAAAALFTIVPGGASAGTLAAGSNTIGGEAACAIRDSGSVQCWGNPFGTPTTIVGVAGAIDVSVNSALNASGSCAATASGQVWCWTTAADAAAQPGITDAVAVTGGRTAGCALRAGGSLSCWGTTPPDGLTRVVSVSLGKGGGCAVRFDGTVACWGTLAPVPSGIADAVQVSVGWDVACVVRRTGAVRCWGIVTPARGSDDADQNVTGIAGAAQVTSGATHTCAITGSGVVKCWGYDTDGQLDGTPSNTPSSAPVASPVTDATDVANGVTFSCARRTSGAVTCWGNSASNLLSANGTLTDVRAWGTPPRVAPGDIALTPTTLAFPKTAVGATSAPLSLTLTNVSARPAPTYLETPQPTSADVFSFAGTTCSDALAAGASCTVSYTFHPVAQGEQQSAASLGVAGQTRTVTLTGAAPTGFTLAPATITFPTTTVGTAQTAPVTIINTGGTTRTLNLAVSGLTGDFAATSGCPATLGPGDTCTVAFAFTPTRPGPQSVAASIGLDGTANPVALSGMATAAALGTVPATFRFGLTSVTAKGTAVTAAFTVPGAGRVKVTATTIVVVRGKRRTVVFASRTTKPSAAGTGTLTLTPTAAARHALASLRRTKVKVSLAFTPAGATRAQRATKTVTVKLRR